MSLLKKRVFLTQETIFTSKSFQTGLSAFVGILGPVRRPGRGPASAGFASQPPRWQLPERRRRTAERRLLPFHLAAFQRGEAPAPAAAPPPSLRPLRGVPGAAGPGPRAGGGAAGAGPGPAPRAREPSLQPGSSAGGTHRGAALRQDQAARAGAGGAEPRSPVEEPHDGGGALVQAALPAGVHPRQALRLPLPERRHGGASGGTPAPAPRLQRPPRRPDGSRRGPSLRARRPGGAWGARRRARPPPPRGCPRPHSAADRPGPALRRGARSAPEVGGGGGVGPRPVPRCPWWLSPARRAELRRPRRTRPRGAGLGPEPGGEGRLGGAGPA